MSPAVVVFKAGFTCEELLCDMVPFCTTTELHCILPPKEKVSEFAAPHRTETITPSISTRSFELAMGSVAHRT